MTDYKLSWSVVNVPEARDFLSPHDFIFSLYTQSDKESIFVLFKQKFTVMSQICYTHSKT